MSAGWTYGAEFELADWDRRRGLPPHMGLDQRDYTMVNSSGIAVDPRGAVWPLGGEALAAPSDRPEGVAEQLAELIRMHPDAAVNYRSNLHVHVRVPGLREDLPGLKRVQSYLCAWGPQLLDVIEPIPEPRREDYPEAAAWAGARARWRRRRVSHHKVPSPATLRRQLAARTPEEFLDAEALHEPTGRLLWATVPRAAVNLRQLRETDTVEFRHFPGMLYPPAVAAAARWCALFLELALSGEHSLNPVEAWLSGGFADGPWPRQFEPYSHWHERRYLATCVKYHPRAMLPARIEAALRGDFDHD